MPSSLFDLRMLPVFKQFESNIFVQDPAQNATNERTNILPSQPRSPRLALLLSCVGISPDSLLVSSPPLLCSDIGLLSGKQPPICNRTGVLLIIHIWIQLSPNVSPGSCSVSRPQLNRDPVEKEFLTGFRCRTSKFCSVVQF